MGSLASAALGLGLAAACGFRVFVPLLALSVAAREGLIDLGGGFAWIASTEALIVLAVATVLEIGAYYVPWLDNLLDTVASPVAVVAGVLVTASVVTDFDPLVRWTLAVIAGGGLAGAVQVTSAGSRQLSTLFTGGLGNPLLATIELGGSLVVSLLALVAPFLGLLLIALFLGVVLRRWRTQGARRPAA